MHVKLCLRTLHLLNANVFEAELQSYPNLSSNLQISCSPFLFGRLPSDLVHSAKNPFFNVISLYLKRHTVRHPEHN